MKTTILSRVLAVLLVLLPVTAFCGGLARVDVLYMNHGPLQPTIGEIRSLVEKYGSRVAVAWHDVDRCCTKTSLTKTGSGHR